MENLLPNQVTSIHSLSVFYIYPEFNPVNIKNTLLHHVQVTYCIFCVSSCLFAGQFNCPVKH